MDNIGNQLNDITQQALAALFAQGEIAQLTYGAFDVTATKLNELKEEEFEISMPVGYRPDRSTINNPRKFTKAELLARYQHLAFHQLAVNGIVQLVTIVEALLNDIVRAVIIRYPQKLGSKRSVQMQAVLESTSIEEIHLRATDALLNDMSYKSPGEFADFFTSCVGINLLECPEFHKYVELKASRDIFIHNRGIVNAIYMRKVGSHARARPGSTLPADTQYFLESYESCLRVTEWLEEKLHEHWHSSALEDRRKAQLEMKLVPTAEPGT